MISKEDFNKVWKDSTRKAILNQFYFEHNDLMEALKTIDNVREFCERYHRLNLMDFDIYALLEKILDILGEEND